MSPGEKYRLVSADAFSNLPPGLIVTVREVVPADEPGAHDNTEEAVVFVYQEPAIVRGGDGTLVAGSAERAFSVAVDRVGELFEEVADAR